MTEPATPTCLNIICSSRTERTGRRMYGPWEISIGGRYRRVEEEFKCAVCGLIFSAVTHVERDDVSNHEKQADP